MNIPYTYLIGWKKLDLWYYGVRYAKDCQPEDLWVTYFTSSKKVAETRALYGEPDVVRVHKFFPNENDRIQKAQILENRMLIRMKVVQKSKWLNGHDSKSFDPSTVPRGKEHWTQQNTEKAQKWLEIQRNGRNQISGDNHWLRKNPEKHWIHNNLKAKDTHMTRMNGISNPNNDPTVKEKKSNYLKKNNPVNQPGVRDKIRNTLTGTVRPRVSCLGCKVEIADVIFKRHHLVKCK